MTSMPSAPDVLKLVDPLPELIFLHDGVEAAPSLLSQRQYCRALHTRKDPAYFRYRCFRGIEQDVLVFPGVFNCPDTE